MRLLGRLICSLFGHRWEILRYLGMGHWEWCRRCDTIR